MSRQGANRKTGFGRWPVLAVALLCVSLPAVFAQGQEPARVALVTTDPEATSTTRLQAELRELGVQVVVIAPDPTEPIGRATLERLAREVGAFAAIRVVPVAAEVEVWVADRVTGKTVVREVLRGSDEQSSVDDAIAVGAVELLRASLLEVSANTELHGDMPPPAAVRNMVPPPEPAAEETPELESEPEEVEGPEPAERAVVPVEPPRPQRAPPPRAPTLALALEPALDVGIGGVPLAVQGLVLLRTQLGETFAAEFITLYPISPAEVSAEEGSAEISTRWYGLNAAWVPGTGAVQPLLGLGIAAIRVDAWGRAAEPFVSQRQHLWTIAPMVRLGASLRLSRSIRLRADATSAFALKTVPVLFADREVARWGRPALSLGVGFEVALPLHAE